MERNLHDPEPRPRARADAIDATDATRAAVRLAAQAADLAACDRMVAALAVHPTGGDFARAELWLWDAAEERLRAGHAAARTQGERPLELALEVVRFSAEPADAGASSASERVPEAAEQAWRAGDSVVEPARGAWAQSGAIPIAGPGRRHGVLTGAWDRAAPPDERHDALRRLAEVAAAMLAAHADERERRRATARGAALAEAAHAAAAASHLSELLHAVARLGCQTIGAEGSAVWIGAGDGAAPRLAVTFGPPSLRDPRGRALDAVVAQVIAGGGPRWIERATDEALLAPDAAAALGAFGVCPIAAFGRTLGALAVYAPAPAHPAEPATFGRDERLFLAALADVAALAADGADRFRRMREGEQRERELAGQLRTEARASTVAELALRALQEARQPATSIRVFAARVLEELEPDAAVREYVEIVAREAERLERLLGEPVDPAVLEPPRLRLENVNQVLQDVLAQLGETLVRRRVRLLKRLGQDVPPLLLDPGRMRLVLGSILHAAAEEIGPGGRIRVESRRADGHVVVEIAHDGPRGPGEALEQLFAPFGGGSSNRARIGLGIAAQVVREHGGEIRVSAEGEWTGVVSFALPIRDNQDRRRGTGERRVTPRERRKRA